MTLDYPLISCFSPFHHSNSLAYGSRKPWIPFLQETIRELEAICRCFGRWKQETCHLPYRPKLC